MAERRQVPRYRAELDAETLHAQSGPTPGVRVVTLSVKGGCLQGAGDLKFPQRIHITIEWEGLEFQSEAEAVGKDEQGRIGFRFLSLNEKSMKLLREICTHLPLQPPNPIPGEKE